MNQRSLLVGPVNGVEGDLEIRLEVEDGFVTAGYANSPLFRGFEPMLQGKQQQDALTITPRICGICSISQSAAATAALAAAGRAPTPQGALVAALFHGVENVCDHITHFDLFFCADFARPSNEGRTWHQRAVARFTAINGSAVRQYVEARAQLLHIVGMLGGKWPHTLAIQPGGVTRAPPARDRIRIAATLKAFRRYLEDVLFGASVEAFAEVATGEALQSWPYGDAGLFMEIAHDLGVDQAGPCPGRFMSFGAYPLADGRSFGPRVWEKGTLSELSTKDIAEDDSHAWMLGETAHPTAGHTMPYEDMADPGYSWCKAPRLSGRTVETGAPARQIMDGHAAMVDLARAGSSARARVVARLLEIACTQLLLGTWARTETPEARFMNVVDLPKEGQGEGLVEAASGALGHWVSIAGGRINRYQIIVPTTGNFSPRDAAGTPGSVEAALVGAAVGDSEDTPLSVQHIVRSFDPRMVCTVH